MNLEQFQQRARRYLKDLLLLPVNVRRLTERDPPARAVNPFEEPHRLIRKSLASVGAIYSNGLIHYGGTNYLIEPPRTIETFNEVVLRRDYEFAWACGPQPYIVIDIGMNVGFAAITKARDPDVIHVYGFEPLVPTYKLALRNIELNPQLAGKISAYNFGLSDSEAQIDIRYSDNEIMSISSEGTFDSCLWGDVRTEIIQVKPAAAIMQEIFDKHPGAPVFLKCDCEGAEFKIFKDLHQHGLFDRISVVVVEWHGQPPDELVRILTASGFSCFSQVINVEWNVGMIRGIRPLSVG